MTAAPASTLISETGCVGSAGFERDGNLKRLSSEQNDVVDEDKDEDDEDLPLRSAGRDK